MSNWKERLSKAFQTRAGLDVIAAEKRDLENLERREREQRRVRDRQENLALLQRRVDALQLRNMLEEVKSVWGVGNISEEKAKYTHNSDINPNASFVLQYSRSGFADRWYGYGGPDNSHSDISSCRGKWTDTLGIKFTGGNDVSVYYWDGHSFDPNRGNLVKGQEWSTGMQSAKMIINRPGHLEVFKNGKSAEVSIESILLELCEQRVLNKQLPLDYK